MRIVIMQQLSTNLRKKKNALVRGTFERKISKKKKNILGSAIFKFFFLSKNLFKKIMNINKTFCRTLAF